MRGRMALLLGMAMLPAGAIAMQVGLNAVSAREAAIEQSLARQALQSLDPQRKQIDELREFSRVLAASPQSQPSRSGGCRAWLGEVFSQYTQVSAIVVTDLQGTVRCSVPAAPPGSRLTEQDLIATARERDGFTIGYVENPLLGQGPMVAAIEPVRDADQRAIGFVGVTISVSRLQQVLDEARELDGSQVAVTDANGRIIARSTVDSETPPPLPTPEQIRSHIGPQPAFVRVEGGEAVLVPLQEPDLYVVLSWRPTEPAWRLWAGYALSVAAPLLIWLLAVAAGWFAIEIYVARPLSSLEAAARGYARGDDAVEDPALTNAPSEIRSLRRTLAAMAKTLRGREARLVEALSEERALLREVHHRVKNNLQMVASLLSIQARGSKDESEAWGLARAHDRVQLLSQVHQRIYSSGEVREIRLDELAADIARQLLASRGALTHNITLELHAHEARANADRAVPMAFLIGEGISTALDSLGEGVDSILRLHLMQEEDGEIRFAIHADAGAAGDATVGARLFDAFARQLGAQIGRHVAAPFMIWACVPPQKVVEGVAEPVRKFAREEPAPAK